MTYYVIDTWHKDARISEHACWVRAGREARIRDANIADARGMRSLPDRYDVTDADGVPLRKPLASPCPTPPPS